MRDFLPQLLANITGVPRYLPVIEWSKTSWTHNLFRVYELIFWRRFGIRAEISSMFIEKEAGQWVEVHQAHSFEGACALFETSVRKFLSSLFHFRIALPSKFWLPRFSLPDGLPNPGLPFMFAIAFDASSQGGDNGGSSFLTNTSYSHTCTGSDRVLVLGLVCNDYTGYTSWTYAGAAGTVTQQNTSSGNPYVVHKYIVAPSTGSNNVTITANPSTLRAQSYTVSYTGCNSTQPDSSGKANSGTLSCTVVASNCWQNAICGSNGTAALTSNKTTRQNGQAYNNGSSYWSGNMSDTNGPVATGSQSIVFSSTDSMLGCIMALAPVSITAYTRSVSVSTSLAASRSVSISRTYAAIRAASSSVSNAVSRLAVVARTKGAIRQTSVSVSNAGSRLASVARKLGYIRRPTVIASNAAARLATVFRRATMARPLSASVSNSVSRLATVGRVKGVVRAATAAVSNAASRFASLSRLIGYKRTPSASVSNAVSRTARVQRLTTMARTAAVSVSNSVMRLATVARQVGFVRTLPATVSNAASRFVRITKLLLNGLSNWYSQVVRSSDDSYTQTSRASDQTYGQVSRSADDTWNQVNRSD